jgi:hypothetical protein
LGTLSDELTVVREDRVAIAVPRRNGRDYAQRRAGTRVAAGRGGGGHARTIGSLVRPAIRHRAAPYGSVPGGDRFVLPRSLQAPNPATAGLVGRCVPKARGIVHFEPLES